MITNMFLMFLERHILIVVILIILLLIVRRISQPRMKFLNPSQGILLDIDHRILVFIIVVYGIPFILVEIIITVFWSGSCRSDDEVSMENRSGNLEGFERVKRSIKFMTTELETWSQTLYLPNQKIIFFGHVSGIAFQLCGVIKLFTNLGFESFIMDLPKEYYPDYVHEFMPTPVIESLSSQTDS